MDNPKGSHKKWETESLLQIPETLQAYALDGRLGNRTSPLKTRFCTQSQLQLVFLPILLWALQPSVTSGTIQKLSPKVHIMLTTELQIHSGTQRRKPPIVDGTGEEWQPFWVLITGHCSHHLKHVIKNQSVFVLRRHTELSSEFQVSPFFPNDFKLPRYHKDPYDHKKESLLISLEDGAWRT